MLLAVKADSLLDRLKDGESVIQAIRRPLQDAVGQRWEMNGNKIHLRNKKELLLTLNVSVLVILSKKKKKAFSTIVIELISH